MSAARRTLRQLLRYGIVGLAANALGYLLYLALTAMGLAPCALALGNVDTATEAFGLDWPVEASVGEFAIGA